MAYQQKVVLIVGATGNVGRQVVDSLLRQNREGFGPQYVVRLLVRDVVRATK